MSLLPSPFICYLISLPYLFLCPPIFPSTLSLFLGSSHFHFSHFQFQFHPSYLSLPLSLLSLCSRTLSLSLSLSLPFLSLCSRMLSLTLTSTPLSHSHFPLLSLTLTSHSFLSLSLPLLSLCSRTLGRSLSSLRSDSSLMTDGPQLHSPRYRDSTSLRYLHAAKEERCRYRRFSIQKHCHQEQGGKFSIRLWGIEEEILIAATPIRRYRLDCRYPRSQVHSIQFSLLRSQRYRHWIRSWPTIPNPLYPISR
jgi:hypothetical protein